MAANVPLSHDAGAAGLARGTPRRPRLDWLNRTVDRLFGFELEPDELRAVCSEPPRTAQVR